MNRPTWEKRIERAEELAQRHAFAAEVLGFYRHIAGFQRDLWALLESASPRQAQGRTGSLRERLRLAVVLGEFPQLLSLVQQVGTALLAESAENLSRQGKEAWTRLMAGYWNGGNAGMIETEAFFARAFLQPCAEHLAAQMQLQVQPGANGEPRCPLCDRRPVVSVLRPEGHGARRWFVCSLCATEWGFPRIICPACGEREFGKLSVYTAAEFEHVRIEACDTCKAYIKAVDMEKDGLAVPVVDELATLPLNLWGQEKGYHKLEPNLLGI